MEGLGDERFADRAPGRANLFATGAEQRGVLPPSLTERGMATAVGLERFAGRRVVHLGAATEPAGREKADQEDVQNDAHREREGNDLEGPVHGESSSERSIAQS